MQISEFLWVLAVIGSALLLHFLINRAAAFYEKRYTGKNERLPGYMRTIRRTLLMLIWLVSLFLCSYAIFAEEMYDTITANLALSVWVGSLVLICVILNTISLSFFDRRIVEYSDSEDKDPTTYKFFKYVSSFVIFLIGGIIIAFSIPGLRSVAQSALAGAGVLAVVIGIASQEVLANIMGGTFIVIFKPFRVGDIVDINTVSGRVEDITLRHTVVNSFQNKRIVIPNAAINKEQIINYNLNERKVCEWIEIGISYDSDIDKALAIMQEEAMNHPYFYDNRTESEINREEPPVRAKVLGLRESSVLLRAWVWARNYPAGFNLRLDLYKSIKERFDEEGIEIPFPHRTVIHKNNVDPS